MLKKIKRINIKDVSVNDLPLTCGVYIFFNKNIDPIYIGKANNIRIRLKSYFSDLVFGKTKEMISNAEYLGWIVTNSELESILLEAKLIKYYQPKYNILSKDDKNPIYIIITKERYPRILTKRKFDKKQVIKCYGPFPNTSNIKSLLYFLRKVFPFSTHRIGKKPCIYSQINLCDPCPNSIEIIDKPKEKDILREKYIKNIKNIQMILDGKIYKLDKQMNDEMKIYSKLEQYEKAQSIKNIIDSLNYISQYKYDLDNFIKNPNFIEDIRSLEINKLLIFLNRYIEIKKINKIECYDISHISGSFSTASMVTFINGQPDKSQYKQFRLRKSFNNDTKSLEEIIKRRIKHLNDWGVPDLIIVDGGKPQVKTFFNQLKSFNIPVVGIAKRNEKMVFINDEGPSVGYSEVLIPRDETLNLLQKIRNEAHRFAKRYHNILVDKNLLRYL